MTSRMFAEAAAAGDVIAAQYAANAALMAELGARLRQLDPPIIFTCARGSSDAAATFAKYLCETRLGIPTVSQSPSISSIYGAPLVHVRGKPFIIISQSGRSPDLLASAQAARSSGALVIAILNDTSAPLAALADIFVPIHAGPEQSVAATKSFAATLTAIIHLVAHWRNDEALLTALAALPETIAMAWDCNWSAAHDMLTGARSLFVLGRGLTLGIAQEAALKAKETAAIHAEAFSIAEVAHGPMALVGSRFPVLVFAPLDRAVAGLDATVAAFAARGALIATVGARFPGALSLPLPGDGNPVTGPVAMVLRYYRMIEAVARARGADPDRPPHLTKVTNTL